MGMVRRIGKHNHGPMDIMLGIEKSAWHTHLHGILICTSGFSGRPVGIVGTTTTTFLEAAMSVAVVAVVAAAAGPIMHV